VTRPVLIAALVLTGCMLQGAGEQELRTRVPGTWVGSTPDGVKLTMHLKPDGTGEVNGHPGTWEIKVGRILLSDGDHLVPCDLDGDTLSCHTPEGDLVMTRATGDETAVAAADPPAPAKPFAPEKTVPGQPFTIAGASFTLPDGWTQNPGKVAGQDVQVLESSEVASAAITIGRVHGEGRQTALLDSHIATYTASQHEVVLPSEDIDIAGQPAARTIIKQDVSEYYAATIGAKDVIFVIVGRYPAERAEAMRPVVETVLASFRAAP
jgi:hypothetical protein